MWAGINYERYHTTKQQSSSWFLTHNTRAEHFLSHVFSRQGPVYQRPSFKMTEQFDVLSETIFVSIIQQELDSISPPAVQCFVDYYNSSRGFTPRRQPCKQWNQLWIYSPLKIKTQRWGRVMLMSVCVSGLISGELFHFIYCVPRALHIKMIKDWLKLFHFASHALSIFEHNMAPSLTWAWEKQIAWISTKSFKKKGVVGLVVFARKICLFHSHTFVGEASPIYRLIGVNWRCQMW